MGNVTFLILLSVVGILFLLAELLIVPGVGVAGILGLVSMAGACYYAFYQMGTITGIVITSVELLIIIAATVYALRAKTWQKLALKTNIESTIGDTSIEVNIGDRGFTETRLAPMGTVRFGKVAVEAKSMMGIIDPCIEVEVVLIEEKKIYVKPVK